MFGKTHALSFDTINVIQTCSEDLKCCIIKLILGLSNFLLILEAFINLFAGKCRFKRSSSPTNGIVYVQCAKTARIWGRLVLDIESYTKIFKNMASFAKLIKFCKNLLLPKSHFSHLKVCHSFKAHLYPLRIVRE